MKRNRKSSTRAREWPKTNK